MNEAQSDSFRTLVNNNNNNNNINNNNINNNNNNNTVSVNSFHMKFNKSNIANVTMAPEVYGKVMCVRCYGALFDDLYVFGNDLNKPAIYSEWETSCWLICCVAAF